METKKEGVKQVLRLIDLYILQINTTNDNDNNKSNELYKILYIGYIDNYKLRCCNFMCVYLSFFLNLKLDQLNCLYAYQEKSSKNSSFNKICTIIEERYNVI